MSNNIIEVKDLHFSYSDEDDKNKKEILRGINLNVKKGEFLAVLGHNGSGKSTLAKHLNAIFIPQTNCGSVTVCGIDTRNDERLYEIRQKAGMVFQNPDNQLVATIVEEDVAFAPENLGVEPSEIRKRVDQSLKIVNMYDFKDKAPHYLSGGQKQRVAIAGVLAMKPSVIIMDEPTAMLDPSGRQEIMETIHKLNREEKMTVVLITHYMDEAASADRVVVMNKGLIELEGTPREVFSCVDRIKSLGLDVPQATELAYRLSKQGINLQNDLLTVDECVNAILEKRM